MTGLDPERDKILEVAAIATDWKFAEVGTFLGVVHVDEGIIKKRMVGEFWEQHSDSYRALVEQNATGQRSEVVEDELLNFIDKCFAKEEAIYLAGNSIHQDRKFIEREWPRLNARLHYRMLDVSAWKIYFEGARRERFVKPEKHRALDDIRGSIEELQWYVGKVDKR
ncbi:oligoribonuclease [Candidatus Saccharibacteria bacterium]|nr:oligoribonuclease [Candidatus Saccharibacteria bacterium]